MYDMHYERLDRSGCVQEAGRRAIDALEGCCYRPRGLVHVCLHEIQHSDCGSTIYPAQDCVADHRCNVQVSLDPQVEARGPCVSEQDVLNCGLGVVAAGWHDGPRVFCPMHEAKAAVAADQS